jgi:hypothetical protein
MPGVELSTSACDGHVVVALRGDLDVTGARHVLRLLALTGRDSAFSVHASAQAAGGGPARSRGTVRWAAARGEHCLVWEGSANAYWYRGLSHGPGQ